MKHKKIKILVLFYSFTGKTEELVKHIIDGAKAIGGTEVIAKRIPEIISDELFHRKPELKKIKDRLERKYPEATVQDLLECDGLILGSPVHFGSMAGQVKQFLDQLSPIWLKNEMVNKPFAVFTAGGSVHGGEEITLQSMIMPLLWLGMVPVGIPYPISGVGPEFDSGSPLGACFTAGHTLKNKPRPGHVKVAKILGGRVAMMAQAINCNCPVTKKAMRNFNKL
jgi:NAD(P)H dehydrogenase (quinone)